MSFHLYFAIVSVLGEKRKVKVLSKVVNYSNSSFPQLWLPFPFSLSFNSNRPFLNTDWTGEGVMKNERNIEGRDDRF